MKLKQSSKALLLAIASIFMSSNLLAQEMDNIIVREGLVAYYTFDDKTANDQWIGGYDGILRGKPNKGFKKDTPSEQGYSLRLNGDVWMILPGALMRGDAWTMCFWIKGRNIQNIVRVSNKGIELRIGINKNYNDMELTSRGQQMSLKTGAKFDEWTHLAIVSTGKEIFCYVNGRKNGERKGYFAASDKSSIAWGEDHTIISLGRVAYNLDNLRFYSIALSQNEIMQLYNAVQ